MKWNGDCTFQCQRSLASYLQIYILLLRLEHMASQLIPRSSSYWMSIFATRDNGNTFNKMDIKLWNCIWISGIKFTFALSTWHVIWYIYIKKKHIMSSETIAHTCDWSLCSIVKKSSHLIGRDNTWKLAQYSHGR